MKLKIPDELKQNVPQSTWGKILSATPVVMTVIATLLAGLASSEMTRAQYDRSFAAQMQSKAGDQWSYFQAKKLRSAFQRTSLDLLLATAEVRPVADPLLEKLPAPGAPALDAEVQAALAALEKQRPETEITELLKHLDGSKFDAALQAARDNALAFDAALAPASQSLDQLEKALTAGDKAAARDLAAAKMRYNATRYDTEARLNQVVANIYELQVRVGNISAERHRQRSGKFFFGMLAAQAAVIIATFAMAAQQRNFLWSIAAIAGLAAVIFAIYVYLRV